MNLRPGSRVNMVAPTVDEAMNTLDLEVVGVFQSFSKDYDDRAIKVSLAAAQELLDTAGFNVLVFVLSDTARTAPLAAEITKRIQGSGLELKTWDSLNDFYWKTVALYDRQFGVLRLIVLVMVILAIAGAVKIGVLERTGEFGTMRALGNRSADVLRLVIAEGAVLGLIGSFLGVLLGVGAALAISHVGIPMPPPPNSNLAFTARIHVVPTVVLGSAAIGLVATLLASLTPALQVARLPVVDGLRRMM
jgi:putative ABC transport system permease protein